MGTKNKVESLLFGGDLLLGMVAGGAGTARHGGGFMHVRLCGACQSAGRDSACHRWRSERFVRPRVGASSFRTSLEVMFQPGFNRAGGLVDVARMMSDCDLMGQTS